MCPAGLPFAEYFLARGRGAAFKTKTVSYKTLERMSLLLTKYLLSGLVAGLFACASAGQAAPVFYSDEVAFQAAAGPLSTDDFSGYSTRSELDAAATDWGSATCIPGAPTSFCVAFSGIGDFASFGVIMRSGTTGLTFATPDALRLDFDAPLSAFGIWVGGAGNAGALVDLELNVGSFFASVAGTTATILSGHENIVPDHRGGNSFFFGVTDEAGFDSITFSGSNDADSVFFDDMSYAAAAAPVPGPLPAGMLLTGLAAFWVARRRTGAVGTKLSA